MTMKMYNNMVMGCEVSEYGRQYGKVDYHCLSEIVGHKVLNNNIIQIDYDNWYLENGADYDEETEEYAEVFQYYIIDDNGADILKRYTDELVYYNENLDMYLWGITHWGTGWDYVLTNISYEVVNY